jgi:hypothetical protein
MKVEHERIASAFEALTSAPNDPDANLAVGRYLCFYKNHWALGLPKLVLAKDLELAAAARTDLQNPRSPADGAKLAEAWWDIGQKQPQAAKRNVYRRVAEWYLVALPGLTGNQRTAAIRRVDQAVSFRGDQPTAFLKEGLLSHWSFDEGSGRLVQDLMRKNHALLSGAGWTRGVLGGAMHTKGSNEYAHFLAPVTMSHWSLSLWVMPDLLQGEAGLFMTTGSAPGSVQLYIRGDGIVQLNIVNAGGGAAQQAKLESGRWHHVAVRYEASKQPASGEIWINGQPDGKFTANKDIAPLLGPARIGGWSDDAFPRTWLTTVDDVRLYGRVLIDSEIQALYAAGQPDP